MYQEKKRSLFFGLPLSFTTYRIEEKVVNIKKGFLRTEEDDTLMYRIQDVKLVTGFLERIFRLGTVVCYSSDVTDSTLELKHIRHAKEVKRLHFSYRRTRTAQSQNPSYNGAGCRCRSV